MIGKAARDKYMRKQAEKYPGYDFASNKGYRSPLHDEGLKKLGVSPIHRKSYAPIAEMLRVDDNTKEAWELLGEE
jgi:ribonuclease HII